MKCILCGMENAAGEQKCRICGFSLNRPVFLGRKQYEVWYENSVKPAREAWTEKLRPERKAAARAQRGQKAVREAALTAENACCTRLRAHPGRMGAFGDDFFAYLTQEGTVRVIGSDAWGIRSGAKTWKQVVMLAAGSGHLIGVTERGEVLAAGKDSFGQCRIPDFSGERAAQGDSWVAQIAACQDMSALLCADGTLRLWGDFSEIEDVLEDEDESPQYWTEIRSIALGAHHMLGLRADGTVVAAGVDDDGQCSGTEDWSGITAVAAGAHHSLGLNAAGRVLACGSNWDQECEVSSWAQIVSVQAAGTRSLGLSGDGRVRLAGAYAAADPGKTRPENRAAGGNSSEAIPCVQALIGERAWQYAYAVFRPENSENEATAAQPAEQKPALQVYCGEFLPF